MRKLVFQLAMAVLISGLAAVLPGCGSSASTDQPTAAPTRTASPPPNPTATSAAPPADDSMSTPTLEPPARDRTESPFVAAPTETASPSLNPTATESAPQVDDSVPTAAPASPVDDGIEFEPVGSSGTYNKEEPITVGDSESPRKGEPGATDPVQGEQYSWRDGDRTLTAMLQTDLVVEKGSGGAAS